jgi:hypothetical protein
LNMEQISILRAVATFIALGSCIFGDEVVAQTKLQPGVYEGLRLAVNAQGLVTGYYRDVQGIGVTKTCSFFLSGRERGGRALVVTWSTEASPGSLRLPGSLQPADQGVVMRIENGQDHPGCASVLPPLISTGYLLDLDSRVDWTSLRRVIAKKSFLLQKPNAGRGRSYLVMGNVVGVLSKSRDWLSVEYANEGKRVRGWIRATDTAELKPP